MSLFHTKIHCVKFGWKWSSDSGNFVNAFLLYHYNLLLKTGVALHLNKLESSSPKNALCQVCLVGSKVEDPFRNIVNVFALCNNLNLNNPRMLHAIFCRSWSCGSELKYLYISSMYFCYFVEDGPFLKTWNPFTQESFVPKSKDHERQHRPCRFAWKWKKLSMSERLLI